MRVLAFPGQGSQYRGMGKELFEKYPDLTAKASDLLGYDIVELCLSDPRRELAKTQYTQPAMFVVNALRYYAIQDNQRFDYFIGHSLGEYNALLAAGAFDFETGLRLVQKRGALMAAASGGGMAAVLGVDVARLESFLADNDFDDIDVANHNTPTQLVVSGPQNSINRLLKKLMENEFKVVPLYVSAPFHSRYMSAAAEEFASFLSGFTFHSLKTPVISNVTARPYGAADSIAGLLARQIAAPVQWIDSIRYLMGQGVDDYREADGKMLTRMIDEIRRDCQPLVDVAPVSSSESDRSSTAAAGLQPSASRQQTPDPSPLDSTKAQSSANRPAFDAARLGSAAFRRDYGIKYSYVAGAMYKGIASKELVVTMAKAGMLSFLGTGGLSLQQIRDDLHYIKSQLPPAAPYGANLLHNLVDPDLEMKTAQLLLDLGIRNIEAAAYMQLTSPLVLYRLRGLRKDTDGQVICDNRVIAKVSRPEVAEVFMRPAPERLVNRLLDERLITPEQAELSQRVPMAHDICVEADSGGHTDGGVAITLLPSIQVLRETVSQHYRFDQPLRIGLAGGIGTPQAIACAFLMGADFVLTGSINQCTVEAGTSEAVKTMLQDIDVQDTDYAPAGDMFEIGARIQVLKKGVLFSARANTLYKLYTQYESLAAIPRDVIERLEKHTFQRSLDAVWQETRDYYQRNGRTHELDKAAKSEKHRMALVFRWYFIHSSRLARAGQIDNRLNFQVHTGPSLGAFNQWAKSRSLSRWQDRHVDRIGVLLMEETADYLSRTMGSMQA